jgi:hypothetical protein
VDPSQDTPTVLLKKLAFSSSTVDVAATTTTLPLKKLAKLLVVKFELFKMFGKKVERFLE